MMHRHFFETADRTF